MLHRTLSADSLAPPVDVAALPAATAAATADSPTRRADDEEAESHLLSQAATVGVRCKLYALSEEGTWTEIGTGQATLSQEDEEEGREGGDATVVRPPPSPSPAASRAPVFRITMTSEDDGEVLLTTPVTTDDIYQVQRATMLVWSDPSICREMAASFESKEGCDSYFTALAIAQRRLRSAAATAAAAVASVASETTPRPRKRPRRDAAEVRGNADDEDEEEEQDDDRGMSPSGSTLTMLGSPIGPYSPTAHSASFRVSSPWAPCRENLPALRQAAERQVHRFGMYLKENRSTFYHDLVAVYHHCLAGRRSGTGLEHKDTNSNDAPPPPDPSDRSPHANGGDGTATSSAEQRRSPLPAVSRQAADPAGVALIEDVVAMLLHPPYNNDSQILQMLLAEDVIDDTIDLIQGYVTRGEGAAAGQHDGASTSRRRGGVQPVPREERHAKFRLPGSQAALRSGAGANHHNHNNNVSTALAAPPGLSTASHPAATVLTPGMQSRIRYIAALQFLRDTIPLQLDEGDALGQSTVGLYLLRLKYDLLVEVCQPERLAVLLWSGATKHPSSHDGATELTGGPVGGDAATTGGGGGSDDDAGSSASDGDFGGGGMSPAHSFSAPGTPTGSGLIGDGALPLALVGAGGGGGRSSLSSKRPTRQKRPTDPFVIAGLLHEVSTTARSTMFPLEPKEEIFTALLAGGYVAYASAAVAWLLARADSSDNGGGDITQSAAARRGGASAREAGLIAATLCQLFDIVTHCASFAPDLTRSALLQDAFRNRLYFSRDGGGAMATWSHGGSAVKLPDEASKRAPSPSAVSLMTPTTMPSATTPPAAAAVISTSPRPPPSTCPPLLHMAMQIVVHPLLSQDSVLQQTIADAVKFMCVGLLDRHSAGSGGPFGNNGAAGGSGGPFPSGAGRNHYGSSNVPMMDSSTLLKRDFVRYWLDGEARQHNPAAEPRFMLPAAGGHRTSNPQQAIAGTRSGSTSSSNDSISSGASLSPRLDLLMISSSHVHAMSHPHSPAAPHAVPLLLPPPEPTTSGKPFPPEHTTSPSSSSRFTPAGGSRPTTTTTISAAAAALSLHHYVVSGRSPISVLVSTIANVTATLHDDVANSSCNAVVATPSSVGPGDGGLKYCYALHHISFFLSTYGADLPEDCLMALLCLCPTPTNASIGSTVGGSAAHGTPPPSPTIKPLGTTAAAKVAQGASLGEGKSVTMGAASASFFRGLALLLHRGRSCASVSSTRVLVAACTCVRATVTMVAAAAAAHVGRSRAVTATAASLETTTSSLEWGLALVVQALHAPQPAAGGLSVLAACALLSVHRPHRSSLLSGLAAAVVTEAVEKLSHFAARGSHAGTPDQGDPLRSQLPGADRRDAAAMPQSVAADITAVLLAVGEGPSADPSSVGYDGTHPSATARRAVRCVEQAAAKAHQKAIADEARREAVRLQEQDAANRRANAWTNRFSPLLSASYGQHQGLRGSRQQGVGSGASDGPHPSTTPEDEYDAMLASWGAAAGIREGDELLQQSGPAPGGASGGPEDIDVTTTSFSGEDDAVTTVGAPESLQRNGDGDDDDDLRELLRVGQR